MRDERFYENFPRPSLKKIPREKNAYQCFRRQRVYLCRVQQ